MANENLLLIAQHLATKDDLERPGASLRAEMQYMRIERVGLINERCTELRGRMDERTTKLRGYIDERVADLRGYIDERIAGLHALIEQRHTHLAGLINERYATLLANMQSIESRLLVKLGGLMAGTATIVSAIVAALTMHA